METACPCRSPPVGTVFGVVLGGARSHRHGAGMDRAYWVPEPILILVLYILMGKRDRIRGKAIGTAVRGRRCDPVAISTGRHGS